MLIAARSVAGRAAAVVLGTVVISAQTAAASSAGRYSTPARIDRAASTVFADAAIAVNAAGDAVAIWDAGFGPGWDIYGAPACRRCLECARPAHE
jgi:hypothetical protein